MPLQNNMKIISVDDHLIENPRVWQDRLSAQFKEAGPTIIEDEAGHHLWRYEGGPTAASTSRRTSDKSPTTRHTRSSSSTRASYCASTADEVRLLNSQAGWVAATIPPSTSRSVPVM